jgi:ubiquinone/menaquinone biosynthesis C-methylase UbiE
MLSEIYRVLSPNGIYICISHAIGSKRKKYLKPYDSNKNLRYNWGIVKHLLPKPYIGNAPPKDYDKVKKPDFDDKTNYHFMYICTKEIEPIVESDNE